MSFALKDGSSVDDIRLGRIPFFDENSREYPVRGLLTAVAPQEPRSYQWDIDGGADSVLNQGREGACVGFAWCAERSAEPSAAQTTNDIAFALYKRAQQLDDWPGEAPEYHGTSVLAGAKAVQEKGWMGEYRWCFSLDDLVETLGYLGPVVLGIKWYDGMYGTIPAETGPKRALLPISGKIVGGHAILARGVDVERREIMLRNSWGPFWGVDGDAWMSYEDMETLLKDEGEACVPIERIEPQNG